MISYALENTLFINANKNHMLKNHIRLVTRNSFDDSELTTYTSVNDDTHSLKSSELRLNSNRMNKMPRKMYFLACIYVSSIFDMKLKSNAFKESGLNPNVLLIYKNILIMIQVPHSIVKWYYKRLFHQDTNLSTTCLCIFPKLSLSLSVPTCWLRSFNLTPATFTPDQTGTEIKKLTSNKI